MDRKQAYFDFINRFQHLVGKSPKLINTTLSNIFTMRLIGNKTHGDLAEIGISEFINQFMYDFRSIHVGKEMYRAKAHEEDIKITNEIENIDFTISLKAYGHGPLQLSTDKSFKMFSFLSKQGSIIKGKQKIHKVFADQSFSEFEEVNVIPLIYDENNKKCNILAFDYELAKQETYRIELVEAGSNRKHPVYRFFDKEDCYICEVRYGGATANALQRGLWTNTKHATKYLKSITNGWVDYSHNLLLVELFSLALVSTAKGHQESIQPLKEDIENQRKVARQ